MTSPLNMAQAFKTLLPINATTEGITSFLYSLLVARSGLVDEKAVCVSPMSCWENSKKTLANRMLTTKKQKLLPHNPYAGTI